ncbi:MAG: hypothetical protein GF383_03810 [Candidatus Lokiarchaeota archaeon]|nr:hypothetical protein [Candidatus Lokiarchaeota archaeon]MBD3338826.1 hypothetical protein [Candidatus Lokiarchaeota archaeon]
MGNKSKHSENVHVEINISRIRRFAELMGNKYKQIKSIYLFGSVARREADEKSDIDLLILVGDDDLKFSDILLYDVDYRNFDDWALDQLEGGVNPFICTAEELVQDFDTLVGKILLEGIKLYGKNIKGLQKRVERKWKDEQSDLLDLVRSL